MSVGDPAISPFVNAFKLLNIVNCDLQQVNLFENFLALLSAFATGTVRTNVDLQNQVQPYLRNSSSAVFAEVESLISSIKSNAQFGEGFIRLVESYWVQAHVWSILMDRGYGDDVFAGYIQCLQLGSQYAEHDQIMTNIWEFFNSNMDDGTLLELKIAFLEEHVAQSLGMDFDTMARAQVAIADDELYRDVLDYLVMSQKNNIAWYMIIDMIQSVVRRRKPDVWDELGSIFSDWRFLHVEDFLNKARDIIDDDDLFADFSVQYTADSTEAFETITDDDDLVDQLKRLQIATSRPVTRAPQSRSLFR
ncbi:hypothetical protein DFJ77DRAFT_513797 [Powellomyces hirtus]|nr:hypothetical protein DFJ77DRAFT_513797 [Powellomyces hirtus]